MSPARPARRRPHRLLVAVALLLALAACSTIGTLVHTTSVLENAGYDDVNISLISTDGIEQLDVRYQGIDDAVEEQRSRAAARIVWEELELYFDHLVFYVSGSAQYENARLGYTRAQLTGLFGPRPAGLDERHFEKEFVKVGKTVVISAAAGLALVVGIGVVIAVMLSRRRRRPGYAGAPGYDPTNPWSPPAYPVSSYPPRTDAVPGDPNDPWAAPPR